MIINNQINKIIINKIKLKIIIKIIANRIKIIVNKIKIIIRIRIKINIITNRIITNRIIVKIIIILILINIMI